MRFRERLYRFFSGRYGMDELNKCLFWTYLILAILLSVIELFYASPWLFLLHALLTLAAIFLLFRTMSRNIVMRQAENRRFLALRDRALGWFRLQKNKLRDRKTHVYRKCPDCKAVLRLKKIKGAHRAACPRCTQSFDVFIR